MTTSKDCPVGCPCQLEALSGLARREFLKLGGLTAAGLALSDLPVMAGPFTREDFEKLVPVDKRLHPDWVKSLFERGTKTVYRWPQSERIGMPVGGITCGQVYLGGDGRLWHWDIFNQHLSTADAHYAKPLQPASPLDQGFALKIVADGKSQVRALDHTGWNDISFIGEYPIGFVEDPGPAVARERLTGGVLPVHPAQPGRLGPSSHGPAIHGD